MTTNHHGWHLDRLGDPTADIVCPHGVAVEHLNCRDYSLNAGEQTYRITEAGLAEWLAENEPWLGDYCAGHTP